MFALALGFTLVPFVYIPSTSARNAVAFIELHLVPPLNLTRYLNFPLTSSHFSHTVSSSTLASIPVTPSLTSPISSSKSISSPSLTSLSGSSSVFSDATAHSSPSAAPPSSPGVNLDTDSATLQELKTIVGRRLPMVVEEVATPDVGTVSDISKWVSTLGGDGKWPAGDVNYASGCNGQRANWPAIDHWKRIAFMAAAWHGGLQGADDFVGSGDVLSAISRAMDFWFANDFTDNSCLAGSCNCHSSGLWNTNWFSNVIGVPKLVGGGCLLLGTDNLSSRQLSSCVHMLQRAAATLENGVDGFGKLTGANTLDVAKISVDLGLLTNDPTMLETAYQHVHDEVVVRSNLKTDGISNDGSFGQHGGILYNGNYGKDYANDVLALEIAAGGTQFSAQNAADTGSQEAFETLVAGDAWMIYRNVMKDPNVLHWDFSVLNRMITFPAVDAQATGSINIDVSQIQQLGDEWNSVILQFVAREWSKSSQDANAGGLSGNRMFFASDYMVHRGNGYVVTLKMYSSRTVNSECINSQNPFGFHLSDGTLYTYTHGNEYEDIAGAWDWNLIPGITTDYGATGLACDRTSFSSSEAFVGGASDGKMGVAAMRYQNPSTKALNFQKAWFFLEDDVQHVMVSFVQTSSPTSNPIRSVLDQKRLNGPVYVDGNQVMQGGNFSQAQSLWHDNVGYTFGPRSTTTHNAGLSVDFGPRTSDWSPIGISTVPDSTVDLFSAWITHGENQDLHIPIAYTAFPAVSLDNFKTKSKQRSSNLMIIQNNESISAVYDELHDTAMFVFWSESGGSAIFTPMGGSPITVEVSGNSIVMWRMNQGQITVSDPSQSLSDLRLSVMIGRGQMTTLEITLPTGGEAGKSVSQSL